MNELRFPYQPIHHTRPAKRDDRVYLAKMLRTNTAQLRTPDDPPPPTLTRPHLDDIGLARASHSELRDFLARGWILPALSTPGLGTYTLFSLNSEARNAIMDEEFGKSSPKFTVAPLYPTDRADTGIAHMEKSSGLGATPYMAPTPNPMWKTSFSRWKLIKLFQKESSTTPTYCATIARPSTPTLGPPARTHHKSTTPTTPIHSKQFALHKSSPGPRNGHGHLAPPPLADAAPALFLNLLHFGLPPVRSLPLPHCHRPPMTPPSPTAPQQLHRSTIPPTVFCTSRTRYSILQRRPYSHRPAHHSFWPLPQQSHCGVAHRLSTVSRIPERFLPPRRPS